MLMLYIRTYDLTCDLKVGFSFDLTCDLEAGFSFDLTCDLEAGTAAHLTGRVGQPDGVHGRVVHAYVLDGQ